MSSSSFAIFTLVIPMTDLSGAGGIILPFWRYFSANLSRRPRKSENLRFTSGDFFLKYARLVFVQTYRPNVRIFRDNGVCEIYLICHKAGHSLSDLMRGGYFYFNEFIPTLQVFLQVVLNNFIIILIPLLNICRSIDVLRHEKK